MWILEHHNYNFQHMTFITIQHQALTLPAQHTEHFHLPIRQQLQPFTLQHRSIWITDMILKHNKTALNKIKTNK